MKLHEMKALRASKVDEFKTLGQKDADSDDGLDESDATRFDELASEIQKLDTRISRVEQAIAAEADSAEPTEDDDEKSYKTSGFVAKKATAKVWASPSGRRPEEKGFKAARYMIGLAHAKNFGRADAAEFIESRFGDMEVAKALSVSGGGTSGGNLIPTAFSADLIELLRPMVAVRDLNPISMDLSFGNLTVPRLTGASTAQYQGELTPIAVSQETFDTLVLTARKITGFVSCSNDLLRRSPVNAEAVIRDDLLQVMARRQDLAFIRGDGSSGTPTGLLSLVPSGNKITAAGVTLANAVSVLQGLIMLLQNGNSRMIRPAWIFNPTVRWFLSGLRDSTGNFIFKQELDSGSLFGFPYRMTTQIPNNTTTAGGTHGSEIYLADFADVIVADTYNITLDTSDVASFVDGSSVQHNSYQEDMSVFRVIAEHDFGVRHLASTALGLVDLWTP